MIARVTFKFNGKETEAIISDEARWFCTNKLVESALDLLCNPKDDGPSAGPVGYRAAMRAASLLVDGVAHFPPHVARSEDVVY